MDINLVVLSAGNSRLALGVFVAGKLQNVKRISIEDRGQWRAAFSEAWKELSGRPGAAIVGASVNPPLNQPIEAEMHEMTGLGVQWVGLDIELPINVLTDDPKQTGVDRVLNVAAAYEQMGKACVVVDAGTAITVNCCSDNGDFLGGAIAPGASLMLNALHEHTAKLPQVTLQAPAGAFGTSTIAAIQHGVFHGIRGMVKELVERYATELGNWPEIIATGGDAHTLFDGWELIHAISPDLTLYGVALAYAEHHIRYGT